MFSVLILMIYIEVLKGIDDILGNVILHTSVKCFKTRP